MADPIKVTVRRLDPDPAALSGSSETPPPRQSPQPAAPPPSQPDPRQSAEDQEEFYERIRVRLQRANDEKKGGEEKKKKKPAVIPLEQLWSWTDNNYPILHTALVMEALGCLIFFLRIGNSAGWSMTGLVMMLIAPLLLTNYVWVKSDKRQRGVRKRWETYYGKALLPSIYFQWPWWPFFYTIKVINTLPIRDPANPTKNPEYVFREVMCNRGGFTDSDTTSHHLGVRNKDGVIDPLFLVTKMKEIKFVKDRDEGGFGDFNVDVTIVADEKTWPDNFTPGKDYNENETRLIAFINFGQEELVLDSVEDLIKEAVKSIGRYCTWQLLENSPEVAFLLITYFLTDQTPKPEESTTQFKARMARDGFADNDGFGIRYRQLNITFTPDESQRAATRKIALEDSQRRSETINAETVAKLVPIYRNAYPNLSDEEIKDAIEVERHKATRVIHSFRGNFPPGNVMYDIGGGVRGGSKGNKPKQGKGKK